MDNMIIIEKIGDLFALILCIMATMGFAILLIIIISPCIIYEIILIPKKIILSLIKLFRKQSKESVI